MANSVDDPQAFGWIFDRYAAVVHRYLASRVGRGAAEDLLSEVFVTAFRSRRSYDAARGDAVPWLLGIATNAVRHHRRSEGRRSSMRQRLHQRAGEGEDPAVGDVEAAVLARDDSHVIGCALAGIDEKYRDALILFSAFDLSYAEIAEVLGLRVGTVRSRISRGRAHLRELLASSGQYEGDGEHPCEATATSESSEP